MIRDSTISAIISSPNVDSQRNVSGFVFWNKTRIYIMFLTLLCLTVTQMNTLTFNFTVICMDDVIKYHNSQNVTEKHWIERPTEKSLLFSGVAIGGLIGLIPSVPLIDFFGLRNVMILSGLLSSIGEFFFPLAVSWSFYASLICRILQGMGVSVLFTGMGVIPSEWAPKSEAATYMAILSMALQLSNVICMPISGILCESVFGWRSIYYIFGIVTFLSYVLFFFTYTNSPFTHRNVSEKELNKIADGKVKPMKERVPYFSVSTDLCVIATWASCIGGNTGFFVLSLYGPTYLREVLHFDVKQTGFISALPFVLAAIFKFVAAQLSDRMSFLSEKVRFVFFAAASQVGLAAGFLIMAMTSNRTVAQIAYTLSIVSSGMNIVGVVKCVQLRCRQHVHFPIAVISFTAYIVQFVAPLAVGFICPDNTPVQWCRLFIIITIVVVCFNVPFPFLSTSTPAEYTKPQKIDGKNETRF